MAYSQTLPCRYGFETALYSSSKQQASRWRTAWRALINETLEIEVLAKVRHCANTGLVLGAESFREQVQRLRN